MRPCRQHVAQTFATCRLSASETSYENSYCSSHETSGLSKKNDSDFLDKRLLLLTCGKQGTQGTRGTRGCLSSAWDALKVNNFDDAQ